MDAPTARPRSGRTRVAAVDCGTNSLRLLVADVSDPPLTDTVVDDVLRTMEVVRLGEGVDASGEISPAALGRTLAATRRVADAVREHGVDTCRVRFVATSASRDARNAHELVDGVRALLGVEPEVVTGAEEASLSFLGATGELHGATSTTPPPFLVCDLGGGSTELVLGEHDVEAARSVDVGCVRLHERHALSDPPTPAQVAALVSDVRAGLDVAAAEVPLGRARTLVGVAGTVTTVTAHALRLPAYLPERIHGSRLPVADVLAACDELVAMTREQRAALPYLHPGRVDVIGAGALVWREVVARVAAASGPGGGSGGEAGGVTHVVTSEHDILDGIALDLARR